MLYKLKNKVVIKISVFAIMLSIGICKIVYDVNANNVIDAREEYQYISETMSLNVIANEEDYVVQRINEKYKNSNIDVYYPVTKYELLNTEMKNIIDVKIAKFKANVKENTEYSLFINFDMYKYNNYVSFVFHVLEDFMGAHPNTYIFTVNYNIKDNSIINIDTLIAKSNNILDQMSKYAYKKLSDDKKIKEINLQSMLANGTKPIKTNFEDFIFTNKGLTIFFEKYKVAPYASGEFVVTIPYIELSLKITD